MKKLLVLLAIVLVIAVLTGCTFTAVISTSKTQTTEASSPSSSVPETEIETQDTLSVAYVNGESVANDDDFYTCYMIVTAYDQNDQAVWSYRTADCAQTELKSPQLFAETTEAVYVNERGILAGDIIGDGYITAIDRQTGDILWRNGDPCGASLSACFDENGTMYCCGYYGPDCMAIDKNGNTLWTVEQVDPFCWWSYEISYENGLIYIFYQGTDSGTEEYRCVDQNGEQFIGGF